MKYFLRALLFWLPEPRHPLCERPGGLHLRWRFGWLKTQLWYRPYCKLNAFFGGPRVEWGKRVSVQGSAQLRGPGRILLGDDTILDSHTTLFTHSREAKLSIGARCYVNGTRFGCAHEITVEDSVILADARIMDTDFHSLSRRRNFPDAKVRTAPVRIGANAWIAAGAGVLKGVTIGRDSVIGFQSVVTSDVPAARLFAGNPAQDRGPIPE